MTYSKIDFSRRLNFSLRFFGGPRVGLGKRGKIVMFLLTIFHIPHRVYACEKIYKLTKMKLKKNGEMKKKVAEKIANSKK